MVDKMLILKKIAELEEYLEQIKDYSGITVTDYSDDWKTQRIVERTLQMIIETCLDIAGHIISDKEYRVPENYADTFRVLHENGVLEDVLFETMADAAKFRNVIVHHYSRIDPEIVVTVLNRHPEAFADYKNAITDILKQE